MSLKKSKGELSLFLIKRGLWLVFAEIVIVSFGWTFNPGFNFIVLQVIWAIGISMVLLGLLIRLPFSWLLVIGVLIVFGHNLLDYPSINKGLKGGWFSDLAYFSDLSPYNIGSNHAVIILYAFLPWTGVMILGYCLGKMFSPKVEPRKRRKMLALLGAGLLLLFLVLRIINGYGDPVPWSRQPRGDVFTFLSFININKYPPSLDFLCVTIGAGLLALALLENIRNWLSEFFRVYGRVPMFYYIVHIYLIHLLAVIFFFAQGYPASRIADPGSPFYFRPPEFGIPLWGVYLVWIFVFLVLYPVCKRYDQFKSAHVREKWWLSYL